MGLTVSERRDVAKIAYNLCNRKNNRAIQTKRKFSKANWCTIRKQAKTWF